MYGASETIIKALATRLLVFCLLVATSSRNLAPADAGVFLFLADKRLNQKRISFVQTEAAGLLLDFLLLKAFLK